MVPGSELHVGHTVAPHLGLAHCSKRDWPSCRKTADSNVVAFDRAAVGPAERRSAPAVPVRHMAYAQRDLRPVVPVAMGRSNSAHAYTSPIRSCTGILRPAGDRGRHPGRGGFARRDRSIGRRLGRGPKARRRLVHAQAARPIQLGRWHRDGRATATRRLGRHVARAHRCRSRRSAGVRDGFGPAPLRRVHVGPVGYSMPTATSAASSATTPASSTASRWIRRSLR